MKRLLLSVLLIFGLCAWAGAGEKKVSKTILDGTTAIAASGDFSPTTAIKLEKPIGLWSIRADCSDCAGTMKVEWLCGNNATVASGSWSEPEGAADILSGITSTSGTYASGYVETQFAPDDCEFGTVLITETGGVSGITPTVILFYRTEDK